MTRSWSDAETQYLLMLAGDLPWPLVVSSYRKWAVANGYRHRTNEALRKRVRVNGGSIKADGAFRTPKAIAEVLGVTERAVQRWIHQGLLLATYSRSVAYVGRDALAAFAEHRPHLFNGRPYRELVMIFDDELLAQHFHKQPRVRDWKFRIREVLCVERRTRYPNVHAAARAVYVAPDSIRKAIARGGRSAGFHWEYVA